MKKEKLSYEQKVRLSEELMEPSYDAMHEDYKVPDFKVSLPLWHVKTNLGQ